MDTLNEEDLVNKLSVTICKSNILLIDVNIPVMDGEKTTRIIAKSNLQKKMVALTMKDDDLSVIMILRLSCCSWDLKDIYPTGREKPIQVIYAKGYFNADISNLNFHRLIIWDNKTATLKI